MAVLSSEGAAALSMRRVARELGVSPMALYNHVENRADLVDAICESFLRWTFDEPGTIAEQATNLFEGYRRWPYMREIVREANPELLRQASAVVVRRAVPDEAGDDAVTRAAEDWAIASALAGGLAGEMYVDGAAAFTRAVAALNRPG